MKLSDHAKRAAKTELIEEDYSLSEGEALARALIIVAIIIGSIFLTIGFFA